MRSSREINWKQSFCFRRQFVSPANPINPLLWCEAMNDLRSCITLPFYSQIRLNFTKILTQIGDRVSCFRGAFITFTLKCREGFERQSSGNECDRK